MELGRSDTMVATAMPRSLARLTASRTDGVSGPNIATPSRVLSCHTVQYPDHGLWIKGRNRASFQACALVKQTLRLGCDFGIKSDYKLIVGFRKNEHQSILAASGEVCRGRIPHKPKLCDRFVDLFDSDVTHPWPRV